MLVTFWIAIYSEQILVRWQGTVRDAKNLW